MTATRLLLGITGSIAAAHTPAVVLAMRRVCGLDVRVVTTAAAGQFVTPTSLAVASGHDVVTEATPGAADVPHMALTGWADLLLVMPATADVLGKAAAGLATDLLTTCILAAECPVAFVPSMNPAMWAKPAVGRNVDTLRSDGCAVVPPAAGLAASDGAPGEGSMPPLPAVLGWLERWTAERGRPLALSGGLRRAG